MHHRGDHYEVELLALPKANSITIRYTTDGSSPTSVGTATYDGPFRVPANCRVVCAMAVSAEYGLSSETIRIAIPQKGGTERPPHGCWPGLLPEEARHGFLIDAPKGSAASEMICITEHRGKDLDHLGARGVDAPQPNDPALRVVIDRARWLALAPAFWDEAKRRLRANGLPVAKFQKDPGKPVPVHPSLGKELYVLCRAVEDASPDNIPNALQTTPLSKARACHPGRGVSCWGIHSSRFPFEMKLAKMTTCSHKEIRHANHANS